MTTARLEHFANVKRGLDDPNDVGYYELSAMARELLQARRILDITASMRDHFTHCDKTMGDSHGCTCGMDAYADLLRQLDSPPATAGGSQE